MSQAERIDVSVHYDTLKVQIENGWTLEMVLQFLREHTNDMISCIKAVRHLYGVSLRDAKMMAHTSETWGDKRAEFDAFHDALFNGAEQLSKIHDKELFLTSSLEPKGFRLHGVGAFGKEFCQLYFQEPEGEILLGGDGILFIANRFFPILSPTDFPFHRSTLLINHQEWRFFLVLGESHGELFARLTETGMEFLIRNKERMKTMALSHEDMARWQQSLMEYQQEWGYDAEEGIKYRKIQSL